MEVYEVADIQEAVELAYKLKDEGQYNWFRGQVQDWPPYSSLYRMERIGNTDILKKHNRRASMFFNWVGEVPELVYLQNPEHSHDFLAIAQHYGIPTQYIDFTTDPGVAGYFAADIAKPSNEGKSCIYCLNTDDLMSLWNAMKDLDTRKGAHIELVTINVQNLWRLQAQRGVFLRADYNWDIDYPMDRILFPYSGYPSYPTRERVYPEHKSPLEQLLDQYFFLETAAFGGEELRQMIDELKSKGQNAGYATWTTFPEGFYEDAFVDKSQLVALESWSSEALRPWDIVSVEDYDQIVGTSLKLKLNTRASIEELKKSVSFAVKQILRSYPAIRSKTVEWVFIDLPESLSQEKLNNAFRSVWNGMRRLPYVDDEIANAFGSVAALLMSGFGSTADFKKLFIESFGECINVGFSYQDESGSYGFATRESLQRALRPDMADLLVPEFKERVNDIHDLFPIIYNPRLMFEFNMFKSMFAREIIPSQVLLQRKLILFNPAKLMIFGNK